MVLAAPAAQAQSCSSPPTGSGGAWFRQYQAWCSACGGTPSTNASPATCRPGPNWGANGGGGGIAYTPQEQAALMLAQVGSQLVANALREMIFGNPQQDAERQAAWQAQRQWEEQERLRLAAQRAREDEERYRRLSVALMDFSPPPTLSLMDTSSSGGLALMTGDAAEGNVRREVGLGAAIDEAGRWATLADQARSPEESVVLADAAFRSILQEKVGLPKPPGDVRGKPAGPFIGSFEPLVKQYRAQVAARHELATGVMPAEYRAELARKAEAQIAKQKARAAAAEQAQLEQALADARKLRERAEAGARQEAARLRDQQERENRAASALRSRLAALSSAPPAAGGAGSPHYINLGYQDAAGCFSQNSGARCTAVAAPDFQACLDGYRTGYRAGERVREALAEQAAARGRSDRAQGRQGFADADPLADGSCRYDYVMSYNRGYFGGNP